MAYELDRQHGNEYRTPTIYCDKPHNPKSITRHKKPSSLPTMTAATTNGEKNNNSGDTPAKI